MVPEATQSRAERCLCLLLQLAASLHFALVYELEHNHFLPLAAYANGQFRLPYQSRVLIGWIMRYAVRLGLVQAIARHMPGAPQLKDPYELLFLLIAFVCIFGAIRATQASLHILTRNPRFSRWAAFAVLYMTWCNLSLSYGLGYTLPYDVPSLFFFSLCLTLILARRFVPFYAVFLIAIVNRETICFVTLFFLLCEWLRLKASPSAKGRAILAAHILAQAILWVAIKSWLTHLFHNNPIEAQNNGLVTFRVLENARFLVNPGEWPQLASIYGFTLPLLVAGFFWIKDRRIQLACQLMLPLWFAIMMVTGVIVEIRIFNELSALVTLACALIVFHWAKAHGLRWDGPATAPSAD